MRHKEQYNAEHYLDPTAYAVMRRLERQEAAKQRHYAQRNPACRQRLPTSKGVERL